MDLTSLGITGCTGYVSVDVAFLVATSGDTAQWTLDIPNHPSLLGLHFFNQALVEDGLANPFGAVVTNAAEGIIGTSRRAILEDFRSEVNLDRDLSSGQWGSDVDPEGEATFGPIGGDGSHGPFSLNLLTQLDNEWMAGVEYEVYALDTDRVVIPSNQTTGGRSVVVTDGVFRFSSFVLPARTKVVFRGSNPPQFHVRGLVDIKGILDLGGEDVPTGFDPDNPLTSIISNNHIGQAGASGAAGGGRGGAGGDKADGFGLQPRFNGKDGEGAGVLAGHAYGGIASDTGGKGSLMNPASGLEFDVVFDLPPGFPFPFQTGMVASGGGGGGHVFPGGEGSIPFHVSFNPSARGSDGQGGVGFPPLLPVPVDSLSHQYFLIPGGGGGGGGGHPILSFRIPIDWHSGGGGAAGGGAVSLRAGYRLATGPESKILVTGGSGGVYDLTPTHFNNVPPPSPGGGGSAGAIVLQCANPGEVALSGFMDARGGVGTQVDHPVVRLAGGDGAAGIIRLETPLPVPSLGTVEPPFGLHRTGELTEIDTQVGFQSRWYSTGKFLPPNFLRYRLDVEIDGVPMTYSDDQVNFPHAHLAGPGEPVVFRVQGAILDPATGQPDPSNIRPWRLYVGAQGGGEFAKLVYVEPELDQVLEIAEGSGKFA